MADLTEREATAEMRRRLPWARQVRAGDKSAEAWSSTSIDNYAGARASGRTLRAALDKLYAVCRKAGLEVRE